MYAVTTLGAVARAPCCAPCARAELGALDPLDLINPAASAARHLYPTVSDRARRALEDAAKRQAAIDAAAREYARRAAAAAAARVKSKLPELPSLPDPVGPTAALVGPSGWGQYVIPATVLAVVGAAGLLLLTRRTHAPTKRKPVRDA